MGLAPYGEAKYVKDIYEHLIDVKPDGSFRLNLDYFNYPVGLTMTNHKFNQLFGGSPRLPESPLTQKEMDLAASIQVVTEDIVLKIAKNIKQKTGARYLCLAGGVALNCVANGKLAAAKVFDEIWIQPAAGDAGGALGAALYAWHSYLGQERLVDGFNNVQQGTLLGPDFSNNEIKDALDQERAVYTYLTDEELFKYTANKLAEAKVVGWFQGRMEFGPRALGNRSILGDARSTEMQTELNLKIKFRESFRPFAPAVLAESATDYFDLNQSSPYMLITAPVKLSQRLPVNNEAKNLWGVDKLKVARSYIPAVTHVDYSARVQTVTPEFNQRFYNLLKEFKTLTNCPVVINTSFNVRGEPIVCTPGDAYRCFRRTNMDVLVLGNYVLVKEDQPSLVMDNDWQKEFTLD
jgi:carbamoyltransferase